MPPSAPALPPAPAVSSEAAPPPPAHRGTRGIRGNLRFALTIAAVLAVLVAVNVLLKFGPPRAGLILSPAVAIVLIVLPPARPDLGPPRPVPPRAAQGDRLRDGRDPRRRGHLPDRRPAAADPCRVPRRPLPPASWHRVARRAGGRPARHGPARRGRLPGRAARAGAPAPGCGLGEPVLVDSVRALAHPPLAAAQPGQPGGRHPGRRRYRRPGAERARGGRVHRAGRSTAV